MEELVDGEPTDEFMNLLQYYGKLTCDIHSLWFAYLQHNVPHVTNSVKEVV